MSCSVELKTVQQHGDRGPFASVRSYLRAVLLLVSVLCAGIVTAQSLLPVPPLTARVMDHTRTLKNDELKALEAKLAAFEAERGTQIVALIIPTTGQEDIAAYAFRVADQWKIGRKQVGDGILVVIAKEDRRARIEVARALEGAVPDLAAFQIINRTMAPAFRQGDFAGGLNAAIDGLIALIRGEGLPLPEQRAEPTGGAFQNLALLFFMGVPIIGSMLIGIFGRKLGAVFTGGAAGGLALLFTGSIVLGILAAVVGLILVLVLGVGGGRGGRGGGRGGPFGGGPVIWTGGRGGGFGGGFGGGGFGSGGGGSFGGGGASGRW